MPFGTRVVVTLNSGCAMFFQSILDALPRGLPRVALLAAMATPAVAQQSKTKRDPAQAVPLMRDAIAMHGGHSMSMVGSDTAATRAPTTMMMMVPDPLGVPMDRMGSGTTWVPDAASLPSKHYTAGQWDLMLHGFVFLQENVQGGLRGASQFGSLTWGMFMASHELAGGRFQSRTMLSLAPP